MSYLEFLKQLLALGPKLPAVIALIQQIISDVQEIIALLNPGPFAAERAPLAVTPAEEAVEAEVVAAMAEGEQMRAIGDGSFLRLIWTFVQAHPELLTLLLSLLAKK